MTNTPDSPKTGLHHRAAGALIPAIKAKISGGMVAGLFFVATGFGPDEWFKRLFAALHLPEYLAAGLKSFDPRVALVGIGVILIGIDILLRHYRHRPEIQTGSIAASAGAAESAAAISISSAPNQPNELPLPDKPSIAVLPFQNLSGDQEQDYFCDGVVDEISTALSRAKWLFVIARNSAFAFKGRNVDTRQIGRELGVRYLLQGSVRRVGDDLRITGTLIEAGTSKNVWADHFDGRIQEIFDLQRRVTEGVVGAVEPSLHLLETDRVSKKPTSDLTAYDLYLRALPHLRSQAPDSLRMAETLLRQSASIDPNYSTALAFLSDCIVRQCYQGIRDWNEGIKAASDIARKAADADPQDPFALIVAAWIFCTLQGRFDEGRDLASRAVRLHPNSAYVCHQAGFVMCCVGDLTAADELLSRALRLNPLDPRKYLIFIGLGQVAFFKRQFEEAIKWFNRSIEYLPTGPINYLFKAAALFYLGKIDAARDTAQFGQSLRALSPVMANLTTRYEHEWMRKLITDGLFGAGYQFPTDQPKELPLPDKPSIAVIPFDNLSGDPEQEYFCDGVVDDVITALSRFKSLFVISRGSSFTYKGRRIDTKHIGRELGVRYLLQGSVRKAGGQLRISGQLIEATTGINLWADSFGGAVEDVFELQEKIARSVASAIAPTLERTEMLRSSHKPSNNLDAVDCYYRSIGAVREGGVASLQRALDFAKKAIAIDPTFGVAYALVASIYSTTRGLGIALTDEQIEDGRYSAKQAIAFGADDAEALSRAAMFVGFVLRDAVSAEPTAKEAIALNPNLSIAWMNCGFVSLFLSKHDEAIAEFEHAIRLSPVDYRVASCIFGIGLSHFYARRYLEALGAFKKASMQSPNDPTYPRFTAMSLAMLGELPQAEETLAVSEKLGGSKMSIEEFERTSPYASVDAALYVDALRRIEAYRRTKH